MANDFLRNVPKEHVFKMGEKELNNLEELLHHLKNANEEEFHSYVGEDYNHFANWIRDIIKDIELADALTKEKTKQGFVNALEKRIIHHKTPKEAESKKNEWIAEPQLTTGTMQKHQTETNASLTQEKKEEHHEEIKHKEPEHASAFSQHEHTAHEVKKEETPHENKHEEMAHHHEHGGVHPHYYTWHLKEIAFSFLMGTIIGFVIGIMIERIKYI
ncbi:MAG: hypothetical protein V1859_07965 [archaeon]